MQNVAFRKLDHASIITAGVLSDMHGKTWGDKPEQLKMSMQLVQVYRTLWCSVMHTPCSMCTWRLWRECGTTLDAYSQLPISEISLFPGSHLPQWGEPGNEAVCQTQCSSGCKWKSLYCRYLFAYMFHCVPNVFVTPIYIFVHAHGSWL